MDPKVEQPKASLRSKIGLVLLIVNVPFGLVSAALGAGLAAAVSDKRWLVLGGAGYVFSWAMASLGLWLAGPAGIAYVKGWRSRWLRRRRQRSPGF